MLFCKHLHIAFILIHHKYYDRPSNRKKSLSRCKSGEHDLCTTTRSSGSLCEKIPYIYIFFKILFFSFIIGLSFGTAKSLLCTLFEVNLLDPILNVFYHVTKLELLMISPSFVLVIAVKKFYFGLLRIL